MHFNKVSRTERTKIRKMETTTTSFPRQKHGMRGKNITPNEERAKQAGRTNNIIVSQQS
jgi:hypothetical protein